MDMVGKDMDMEHLVRFVHHHFVAVEVGNKEVDMEKVGKDMDMENLVCFVHYHSAVGVN